ncbi:MAG: hypothetical protein WDO14_22595 [Bacteroidota bacterium]
MHKRILPIFFALTTSFAFAQGDPTDTTEVEQPEMISEHTSEIEVCGFSSDGKYFVFTQVVPGDYNGGTGYVYVIDVTTNNWAHKPAVLEPENADWTTEEIKDSLHYKRDSVLTKYKVKRGSFGQAFGLSSSNKIVVGGKTYALELNTPNNLIDFHLTGNGKDIILQKDKQLPKSRGSVRAYRLHKAYVFGDKIAVFIEYDGDVQEGFENMRYYNRKYIAVTAVVK